MVTANKANVTDDVALLEQMMKDTRNAPAAFAIDGPTAQFLEQFYTDARDKGLEKMAREGSKLLNTIGALNFSPLQQMEYNLGQRLAAKEITPTEHETLLAASRIVFAKPGTNVLPYELSLDAINRAAYRACDLYAQSVGARRLEELSMSEAFYPEYTFEIEGRKYSYLFLYYYCRYVFCAQHVDFGALETVVEVGSGSGRAVEILKKLHPHLSFLMFDLAPELYVSHRFLSAVFPEAVVDYDRTRAAKKTEVLEKGSIHFYPHSAFGALQVSGRALSWNTMVFCIMAPEKARTYFEIMKRYCECVYVVEPVTEAGGGQYGLQDPMTWKHYEEFMRDGFNLAQRARAFRPLADITAWGGVDDMLWKKSG